LFGWLWNYLKHGKNKELLAIWCAKETYFKMKLGDLTDLREAITVLSVFKEQIKGKDQSKYYKFGLIQNEDLTLVFSSPLI